MSALAHELADALHSEGEKTLAFLRALSPEQMQTRIYEDGLAWTTHDLLAHFVEVEGSIGRVMQRVAAGGEGVPADFNINRWNASHTSEMSTQHDDAWLLDEFARRRAATVEWVRGLSDEALERRGRHPALGETEVKHMAKLMYIHLIGHQRDIKRALQLP
ncbi:MAG: DinB family protein [Anaerolineales bacterium]|nr:DinB family protein [Anaerolineales bacterium]MBX3005997.1 DinB family protein [Anaerolineales bacterium]MCW5838646.1 DinB family protein [Anaerolineales bacterium]